MRRVGSADGDLAAAETAEGAAFGVGERCGVQRVQGLGQPGRESLRGPYPLPSVLLAVEVPDRHQHAVGTKRAGKPGVPAEVELITGGQPSQRGKQLLLRLRANPSQVRLI